jgi:hypothetical protein
MALSQLRHKGLLVKLRENALWWFSQRAATWLFTEIGDNVSFSWMKTRRASARLS